MTNGLSFNERKRRIFIFRQDDTIEECNKRYDVCNSFKKRKKFGEFNCGAESKYEHRDEGRIIQRNRAIEKSARAGVFRPSIPRFLHRFRIVLPLTAQFLEPKDVVCLLKVGVTLDCEVYHMMGYKNKTECMINYWMEKGKTFLWVYSNIISKRVQREAAEYAKCLPNRVEIGHKLFLVPLMF